MSETEHNLEQQLRDADVPWPKTLAELTEYIDHLTGLDHDYGTCVYAVSNAATAAFHYMAHRLGITGFQASCADMDLLRRTRGYKHGFAVIDYGELLYPQYREKFDRLAFDAALEKQAEWLAEEAANLLADSPNAADGVRAHWERLVGAREKGCGEETS